MRYGERVPSEPVFPGIAPLPVDDLPNHHLALFLEDAEDARRVIGVDVFSVHHQ